MSAVKWIHVLKRIEKIEQNIEELIQIEKSISPRKEYYEPLLLSIEQQINHFVDERVKLRDLRIENPPEYLLPENQSVDEDEPQERVYPSSFIHSSSSQEQDMSEYNIEDIKPRVSVGNEVTGDSQQVELLVDEEDLETSDTNENADVVENRSASRTKDVEKKSSVSSIEKFARSLDVNAKKEQKSSQSTKDVPKSRQDILNNLSQIDY